MRRLKRRIYLAITAVAMAAMALPIAGVKVGATTGRGSSTIATPPVYAAPVTASPTGTLGQAMIGEAAQTTGGQGGELAPLSDDIRLKAFGIEPGSPRQNSRLMSQKIGDAIKSGLMRRKATGSEV